MEPAEDLLKQFNDKDPEQLKKVIVTLIHKSRILLTNLEETCDKLEESQKEKDFWKESYFHLKQACLQYVQCGGLTPFSYIASLEDQLKKQKVYKSCLDEKFKVMRPHSTSYRKRSEDQRGNPHGIYNVQGNQYLDKLSFSTFVKETPQKNHKQSTKHKIGPKSVEFFKFGDPKNS